MPRRLAWFLFVTLAACGGASRASGPAVTGSTGGADEGAGSSDGASAARPLAFAHRIDDGHTWELLAARPENHVVARTEVVKFLIDLENEGQIWFTDTHRWSIHFHFATQFLNVPSGAASHRRFNDHEYRQPDRRFIAGSLVHYLDPDLWTFEMIAGDNLEGDRVLSAFEQVRSVVFFGDQLRYRPISALHEEMTAVVADRLPRVTAQDVFAGVSYQPLTHGVAYGTLRFVRGALDIASARPDQILVLEQLPDEIPVVSGVISAQLQAPLGHVAILCGTRGTPNIGLRGALSDPRLTALEGQLVRFEVATQDLSIAVATREEAERAWAARRPAQTQTPRIDRGDHGLMDVCNLRYGDSDKVGAKAAQLGEACAIGGPIRTPGGFAIPFHDYLAHLSRSGLAQGLSGMLADDAFRTDMHIREQRLNELRTAIQRVNVDPALLRAVRNRIRRFPGQPRVIFRSSTNAEDLAGFTGAGLYRSVVVRGGATDTEIADALREVWASVWLQGAYEEREWYRIDHAQVAMGVLVQPFVDGATANGVAITQNPFFARRPGYFINAQALGGSVTGAGGDEIPEQHLIYTYQGLETELVSRSSRNGGAPLMREPELLQLAEVLRVLHERFMPIWLRRAQVPEDAELAAEVEFLVAGADRHIVVLQARPFVVTYAEGQL